MRQWQQLTVFQEDEEIDELEEELDDADDDQASYQGFDDGEFYMCFLFTPM